MFWVLGFNCKPGDEMDDKIKEGTQAAYYLLHWNEQAKYESPVEDPDDFGSWAGFETPQSLQHYVRRLRLAADARFLIELTTQGDLRPTDQVLCAADAIAAWKPERQLLPSGSSEIAESVNYDAARLRFLRAIRLATDSAVAANLLSPTLADALLLGAAELVRKDHVAEDPSNALFQLVKTMGSN